MTAKLTLQTRELDGVTIIALQGDLTSDGDSALKNAYHAANSAGAKHILFDLEKADYINTSGIAVLITIVMDAKKTDQKVLVCGASPHYKKVFDLVRLPLYVTMFDTQADALTSLQ